MQVFKTATVDLLGNDLSPTERRMLTLYLELKELASDPALAPTSAANIRDALSSMAIAVAGLALEYEQLMDQGC